MVEIPHGYKFWNEQNVCHQWKKFLREKIVDISPELFVENVFIEMDQRYPCVFDILVSLCTPMHIKSTHKNQTVAAMYGIALNAMNNQINLMQKLLSAACIRYGAGNGVSREFINRYNCKALLFVTGLQNVLCYA